MLIMPYNFSEPIVTAPHPTPKSYQTKFSSIERWCSLLSNPGYSTEKTQQQGGHR